MAGELFPLVGAGCSLSTAAAAAVAVALGATLSVGGEGRELSGATPAGGGRSLTYLIQRSRHDW